MTARPQVVPIVDRRTGEEWQHIGMRREGRLWVATVKNLTTGQVVAWGAMSPKFALYDALVKCGCPRDAATTAAKTAGWG